VELARGLAERDHAYVLSCLGRDREAMRYVERAERTFAMAAVDGFDLERLEVVRERARRLGGGAWRTERTVEAAHLLAGSVA
jgi:hypothetical protein